MPRTKRLREFPEQRTRLTLSWNFPDKHGAALIFNKTAWRLFEAAAEERGIDPEEMISVTVVQLLGNITNYRLKA